MTRLRRLRNSEPRMGGSRRRAIAAAVAVLLGWSAPAAATSALPAPQTVDLPRAAGLLHALLYKPGGDGPFPTVIALHGCGGLSAGAEPLRARYVDWVQHLLKAGHAVLLPDSYGSRELGPQCRLKERRVQARRERVADIATARQWLLQQPWVAKQRISLLGFANGASALLWAVRPQSAFAQSGPDFRSAVAFYPDCRLSSGLGWSARVPTLLLIGGSDDVSSPSACRQMIDGARGRSALAKLVVYQGAAHGFDRLNVALHDTDHSASADEPDHGHVGSDPTARADAEKRVAGWLGR